MTFENLKFDRTSGGWRSQTDLDNGFKVSVVAGVFAYSTPREDLSDPQDYSAYEIAIFDSEGEWATRKFVPDHHDDVIGYLSKEDISSLISNVTEHVS